MVTSPAEVTVPTRTPTASRRRPILAVPQPRGWACRRPCPRLFLTSAHSGEPTHAAALRAAFLSPLPPRGSSSQTQLCQYERRGTRDPPIRDQAHPERPVDLALYAANNEMVAWAGETFVSSTNAQRAASAFKRGPSARRYDGVPGQPLASGGGGMALQRRRSPPPAKRSRRSSTRQRAATNVQMNAIVATAREPYPSAGGRRTLLADHLRRRTPRQE